MLEKMGVYAWSEHCVHVQLWVFLCELYAFEIGQFITASVHVLSPTLESTSSLISCFPRWLGVTGTHARCLFKNCCLWDISISQAAKGISCELIVLFWTRSFTAVVTESGPKSKVHWIPSFETEKIKIFCELIVGWLVDSRLKLKKMIW